MERDYSKRQPNFHFLKGKEEKSLISHVIREIKVFEEHIQIY